MLFSGQPDYQVLQGLKDRKAAKEISKLLLKGLKATKGKESLLKTRNIWAVFGVSNI